MRSALELVIAARGMLREDRPKFEVQNFHVLMPAGASFFPDLPDFDGDVTNRDGSLRLIKPCTQSGCHGQMRRDNHVRRAARAATTPGDYYPSTDRVEGWLCSGCRRFEVA